MDLIEWQAENRWPSWILAERLGISANMLSQVRRKRKVPSLLLAKAIVAFTRGQVSLVDLGLEDKCSAKNCVAIIGGKICHDCPIL